MLIFQTLLLSLFVRHISSYRHNRFASPRLALSNRISPKRSLIDSLSPEFSRKSLLHVRQDSLALNGKIKDDILALDFDDSDFPPSSDDLASKFFDILKSNYLTLCRT